MSQQAATAEFGSGPTAPPAAAAALEIFATCPQSRDVAQPEYLRRVAEAARWSEAAGCTGTLVYSDNGIVDAWLVAQIVLANTERLCPLVAVQPIYLHPYAAAKMVASFGFLHRRRVYLNMVAGGFRGDLQALDDPTAHDDRYARLTEYTLIIKALLQSPEPVTFEGRFYAIRNLRMAPALPPELRPGLMVSGSSPAGAAMAQAVGATGIIYPRPADQEDAVCGGSNPRGVRLGVIARASAAEAWEVAHRRFPDDPRGRVLHRVAMGVSDSMWHKQLSHGTGSGFDEGSAYWLWPFQSYKTFCPYLVGSFEEIAHYLRRYLDKGYRTFILDVPRSRDDLDCAMTAFATALAASPS